MIDFLKSIVYPIAEALNMRPLYVGIIGLALGVIVLALVILFIAKRSKKRKAKKLEQSVSVVKDVQPATEKVEEVKAEETAEEVKEEAAVEAVEEVEAEPVVEEKAEETKEEAVVEEESAPVEQAEEIATEPVVEEVVEQPVQEEVKVVEPVAELVVEEEKAVEPAVEEVKPEKPAKKTMPKKATTKKEEPAKPAKKDVKPVEPVKPVKEPKKLLGKWSVEKKSDGEYISKLAASNGEVMLSSEIYTTEDGARSGIETIIKGVDSGKFVIYQDKSKNYYYKLKSTGNRLLCVGEIYKSKDQCLKAVESVKRIAKDSPVMSDLTEGVAYAEYTPAAIDMKGGMRGKWRVETTEEGNYTARLYANNGQLMLATEEVSQIKSAKNAIESVKKNAEAGNFIIDHDKFGRFYYKLRNAQKSVICIGEAYEKLDSCISAIESVRRFALNAIVVEDEKN